MFLRLGICALGQLTSRFLEGGQRDAAPLRQQAQVRVAADRSLMADLTQEITHAGMILQIPQRQIRWKLLDMQGPGSNACREGQLQDRPKRGRVALRSHPQQVVEIALGPKVLRGDEHAPAGPERARKRDDPIGRVPVQRDGTPGRPAGTAGATPAASRTVP